MSSSSLCVLQHALRLLAFGQLYKVLNMDPLPASKLSARLLEGVPSVVCFMPVCVFDSLFSPVCICDCLHLWLTVFISHHSLWCCLLVQHRNDNRIGRLYVMFHVLSLRFLSAGGCQKRLRDDAGPDDRDFIKRLKGDFDHHIKPAGKHSVFHSHYVRA